MTEKLLDFNDKDQIYEAVELFEKNGYTVFRDFDVPISVEDADTDDLISEIESRGYHCSEEPIVSINLEDLFLLKRNNSPDFDKKFSEFIYLELGRIL